MIKSWIRMILSVVLGLNVIFVGVLNILDVYTWQSGIINFIGAGLVSILFNIYAAYKNNDFSPEASCHTAAMREQKALGRTCEVCGGEIAGDGCVAHEYRDPIDSDAKEEDE